MSTHEHETRMRAAAYMALLDNLATESGYWLLGQREDPERIQSLSDAVDDPSTVVVEPETPGEG